MKMRALTIAGLLSLSTFAGDASAESVTIHNQRTAQYHVARSGDTLYDLAGQYLGDPLRWPLLWSYNPHITNPHWIYPGDIIYLNGPDGQRRGDALPETSGLYYPVGGFYTGEELDNVGTIRYADTGRRLLQPEDRIYVEFEDRDDVRVGDVYVINRVLDRVYDRDDELVAVKYIATGAIEVTEIRDEEETRLVTARITELWDVIERGDAIFASEPQRLLVRPRINEVDLEAEILDTMDYRRHIHEQDYVFINRGIEDGVRPGNRFEILQRHDEGEEIRANIERRLEYSDIQAELPWEHAGEVIVIYVTDEYATGIIVDGGMREFTLGERLVMRAGY